jgi:hypothetical protein
MARRPLRTGSGLFPVGILGLYLLLLLLSPPSCAKGIHHSHVGSAQNEQRRHVMKWNGPDAVSTDDCCYDHKYSYDDNIDFYPLPRVEIQFICAHDVRPNFSPTDILQQYYVDEYLSKVKDYNPKKESFKLNGAMSINDIGDIDENKWFFPLCNQSSTDVLVTMDVFGYFDIQGQDWVSTARAIPSRNTTQYAIIHMDRRVGTHSLRQYFNKHVCLGDNLISFECKSPSWNDPLGLTDYPPPVEPQKNSSYSLDQTNSTNPPYPSSTENPYFFEHNLYLLCGNADDDMMLEGEELPNTNFVVLGLFVGMVMVGMIATELKQSPEGGMRGGEPPLGHPDGFLVRRELEMV